MKHTSSTAIVAEIRAEIARQGVEQRDLAKTVGLSPSALSRRLTGQSDPSLGEVARICSALHITFPDLVQRADLHAPGAMSDTQAAASDSQAGAA